MSVKIYVEGGGDHNKALQTQCRRGFSEFFRKAGLKSHMPAVVPCGARTRAFDSFRTSHENAQAGTLAVLLVDSEAPVTRSDAWEHVRHNPGDGWQRPRGASPDQIHLKVQAMEAWFHADKPALERYYGRDLRPTALTPRPDIDNIGKVDLFAGLERATRNCQKGEYSKGQHSFEILALIDPEKVRAASPAHAGRLLDTLRRLCTL